MLDKTNPPLASCCLLSIVIQSSLKMPSAWSPTPFFSQNCPFTVPRTLLGLGHPPSALSLCLSKCSFQSYLKDSWHISQLLGSIVVSTIFELPTLDSFLLIIVGKLVTFCFVGCWAIFSFSFVYTHQQSLI